MRAAIALVPLLGFVSLADEPLPKELAELQGVWKLDAGEANGAPLPFNRGAFNWVIEGDKVLCGGVHIATLKLDATKTPRTIDLVLLNPKRTRIGIYELDGDTFRFCVDIRDDVKARPKGLPTVGTDNLRLLFFQRQKGDKVDPFAGMRGFLGVQLSDDEENQRVTVADVVENAPAMKAGVKAGDVLLKLGAAEVRSSQAVIDAMATTPPGKPVALVVRRDGKERTIELKPAAVPFDLLN